MRRLFLFLLSLVPLAAQPLRGGGPLENDPSHRDKPYVVLISLDGFRFDYAERDKTPNILKLRDSGSYAGSLLPVYPTTTFPNHLSLVTGMYPAHHGIVENNFYDPVRKAPYVFRNPAASGDGTWYLAKPLWILAEQQGMRTACMFWPSSDAEISGTRPTYYFKYSSSFPYEDRVKQVLEWLRLPAAERPHLITLYFSLVDEEGHAKGPDSDEVKAAVQKLDAVIGRLMAGLDELKLPVNVILASDHGMQPILPEPIDITGYADLSGFQIGPSGGQVMLYSDDEAKVNETVAKLRAANDPRIEVYRRSELPERLHYRDSHRVGDIVVVAQTAQLIRSRKPVAGAPTGTPQSGTHGFDPAKFPLMQGIFYAAGPNIRPGLRLPSFENIHVMPLIAKILGLMIPPDVDGHFSTLAPVYRKE